VHCDSEFLCFNVSGVSIFEVTATTELPETFFFVISLALENPLVQRRTSCQYQVMSQSLLANLSSPFVDIEGIINVRSVGDYPVASSGLLLRSPVLFRSGEPSSITPRGKCQLIALGIRRVFDLRSDIEIDGYKTSTPTIEGIEIVRAPVSQTQAYDPISFAPRYVSLRRILFTGSMSQANRLNLFATNETSVSVVTSLVHVVA
jgi:hypothetical protein